MAFYRVVDHRAPRYLPHNSASYQTGLFQLVVNISWLWVSILVVPAMLFVNWTWLVILLLVLWVAVPVVYNVQYRRWVYGIPEKATDDFHIDRMMQKMLRLYRANPAPMVEPVLIGAYGAAKAGDAQGVRERHDLIDQYYSEFKSLPVAGSPDIEDFKRSIDVLRDMKKEGLL